MENKIAKAVMEESREREITPITARGTGSRLLGVPHDDSDWDVRMVFTKPTWAYAGASGWSDTYDIEVGEIDIHAWDLEKFVGMVSETNPSAVEFLLSDIIYIPDKTQWLGTLRDMILDHGNRMALYHHYLSLAEYNYRQYIENGNDCTRGRQFYIMRATMVAKHIRKTNEIPPMNIWSFLRTSDSLTETEEELLRALSNSKLAGNGSDEIDDVVGNHFQKEYNKTMEPTDERIRNPRQDVIDKFVKEAIIK